MPDLCGINVIGHVSGNLGLGVLARNIVRLIRDKGIPVAVLDVDAGAGRSGIELEFASLAVASPADLPHGINLFILPPPTLQVLLPSMQEVVVDPRRMNVALPMWELSVLPPAWMGCLEFFDVIVAGTPFIRHALEFALSGVFVIGAHCPSQLPARLEPDRDTFDMPRDKVVFVAAFEPNSDVERKNPAGAIEAFLRHAARTGRSHLLIKVNAAQEADEHPSIMRLRALARGCEAVSFYTRPHTHAQALRLYASADVIVSLHRGEGLGLVPMEAMALGKPVIATAWSGNLAYMDHRSACLVGYRLVPVKGSDGLYEKLLNGTPAVWAEPDLEAAAEWMRQLDADAGLRASIGAAGQDAVRRYQAEAQHGAFLDELMTLWLRRALVCKNGPDRARHIALVEQTFRRQMLVYKLTSPEAWRLFARNRLPWLFGQAGGRK